MRILYLDLIAGVSGDMLLSTLLACGTPYSEWKKEISKLKLPIIPKRKKVKRGHIKAFSLIASGAEKRVREPREFLRILSQSSLKKEIKDKAEALLTRLFGAEAKVHQTNPAKIHLHELGEYDTLFDIVGSLLAIDLLGIKEIYASPIPLGKKVAPVTLELLKGIPVYGKPIDFEITTPTGALLLTSLVKRFTHLPLMKIERIGYGTGSFELETPNLLRGIIGEIIEEPKKIFLVETNLDNMSPEIFEYLMERLFAKDALDVFFTPIYAKKNRPAVKVSVMVSAEKKDEIIDTLFRETRTLGVRVYPVERYEAEREIKEIKTEYGKVRVKIGSWRGAVVNVGFEYEDLKAIAKKKAIPLKFLYERLLSHLNSLPLSEKNKLVELS